MLAYGICFSLSDLLHSVWQSYYSAIKRNKIELSVVRWMDLESVTPAVLKLTFVPRAACSHTSSWLGVTSSLCHYWRGRNAEHSEKNFSVHAQEYSSRLGHCGSPDGHLKGHTRIVLCLLQRKRRKYIYLELDSLEKNKTINLGSFFSHCLLFQEIG